MDPQHRAYLRAHPLANAGYRVFRILSKNGNLSERGEIPFITSYFFPVALVGYLLSRRLLTLLSRTASGGRFDTVDSVDHLFSMTSDHGYRTHAFVEVAMELADRDESVLFLCSPEAEKLMDDWRDRGIPTVTHRETHGHVRIHRLPRYVVESLRMALDLHRLSRGHLADSRLPTRRIVSIAFNYLLLEHVKADSIQTVVDGDSTIHTYSPMPYLLVSARLDRIFVYQHGVVWSRDELMEVPSYVPLTYFIWSDVWRGPYERCAHPESDILAIGSPWYDYLERSKDDRPSDPEWDVLYIGAAQGITKEWEERAYEDLVTRTVEICEERDLSLAIKLHPIEARSWYDERGYGGYVEHFDDIDRAIMASRIAVTNISSTFIEAAVLETPVIVTDVWERGIGELGPVEYVTFTDGLQGLDEAIEDALHGASETADSRLPSLVELGGAAERIADVTLDRSGGADG